jgi:hypothetical protein
MALTHTEIRKAKPQSKPYKLSDGAGLYIWITPSRRQEVASIVAPRRKAEDRELGGYPEVSLALARERHRDARKLLAEAIPDGAAKGRQDRP